MAAPSSCATVQVVSGTNVTVQAVGGVAGRSIPRRVLVPVVPGKISKLLLKCTSKDNKKELKTFSIRNIDVSVVNTCDALKTLIKAQLGKELLSEFDVGYYQGSTAVSVRTSDDLCELWSSILKGTKVDLWCDGLRKLNAAKRKQPGEDSDEDEQVKSAKKKKTNVEEKTEAVEAKIEELKKLHKDSGYSQMQYRIWAEMLCGGINNVTLTRAPSSTMFIHAGGGAVKPKKQDTLSQAITQIASALSPNGASATSSPRIAGTSPARLIDNRSKCYKQLADLNNLKQTGLLDDNEYLAERQAIMGMLDKLK